VGQADEREEPSTTTPKGIATTSCLPNGIRLRERAQWNRGDGGRDGQVLADGEQRLRLVSPRASHEDPPPLAVDPSMGRGSPNRQGACRVAGNDSQPPGTPL
jgi:hypothetical protein